MNPVITDIKIEPEKLAELNRVLSSSFSKGVKKAAMARIGYRGCTVCGETPSKRVRYDIGDSEQPASRLEYYCDKCFVRLTATNGDQTIAVRDEKYPKGA